MDQFKAIGSVRMSMKHTKRKKEMGKKMDPGRVRLGKKMDRLEEYTSLQNTFGLIGLRPSVNVLWPKGPNSLSNLVEVLLR